MPSQVLSSVENNFSKGLITEATGLNFPENACTSVSNCVFTLVGDVTRRLGINQEVEGVPSSIGATNSAYSTYIWNNPGGDGNSKLFVTQVGANLYFYSITASTTSFPLSRQLLSSSVNISSVGLVSGGIFDATAECQFSDGNGYLFVFHPSCDPVYITYNSSTKAVSGTVITVNIRDFLGVADGLADAVRPSSLTNEHLYNLINQGWNNSTSWQANSTTVVPWASLTSPTNVNNTFTVGSGLPISPGVAVLMQATIFDGIGGSHFLSNITGVVVSYSGTNLVVNTNPIGYAYPSSSVSTEQWAITPVNPGGQINVWQPSVGNYPSNSDVWWTFKDTTGKFNPVATFANVTSGSPAPKGSMILNAFNQDRSGVSGVSSITVISTLNRPTTGTWFQQRVWYTGVSAQQAATGDAPFYTWTENIYFSQIIEGTADFGKCYQVNDPTNENLFDLLPTDGGVITIVGSGTINKLFPIANGLIVFANNGIWFITGTQGIGFSASDYTITKISAVQTMSNTSFVDVLGLPYFWNEEGIYKVVQNNSGQLSVEPLTVGTILSYYDNIPFASKKYARGSYDPINYIIQWCYRSTQESTVTSRYQFDTILIYNTYNQSFYVYNIQAGTNSQYIADVKYVSYSSIVSSTPLPGFKYLTSLGSNQITFAEEYDTSYQDWGSTDYTSSFTTGYKLHGSAWKKFQVPYILTYSRNTGYAAFYIQGAWDYGINFDSNRWSVPQFIELNEANTGVNIRRHKIRGRGYSLQIMVTSVSGQPFDLMGWAVVDNVNTGT